MRHLRGLDGIRGFAVLAVLVHHLTYGHLPGGFLGVELFFVLSGYLITSLLALERERTGFISLRRFYVRRALRLLPALVLTLALVGVLQARVRPLTGVVPLPWAEIAVVGYVANWVSFPGGASLGYLGHAWSLSIEEQFYALWPLVVIALPLDRLGGRPLGILCASGAGLATVATAAVYAWLRSPGAAMSYATFTHVPAILLGCLLAVPGSKGTIASRLSSPLIGGGAGLALLAAMFVVRKDAAYMYFGGYCLASLMAALLIGNVASSPAGKIARVFALGGMPALGKVSYGLYLYHLPVVLATEGVRVHGWASFLSVSLLRVVVSLGIAVASYHFVERRFLRLKSNLSPLRIDTKRTAPRYSAPPPEPSDRASPPCHPTVEIQRR